MADFRSCFKDESSNEDSESILFDTFINLSHFAFAVTCYLVFSSILSPNKKK